MNQSKTVAEKISELLHDDGQVLVADDGRTLEELLQLFGGTNMATLTETFPTRCNFPDGSAIVVCGSGEAWDLPLSPENEFCVCFESNVEHNDLCPVVFKL